MGEELRQDLWLIDNSLIRKKRTQKKLCVRFFLEKNKIQSSELSFFLFLLMFFLFLKKLTA